MTDTTTGKVAAQLSKNALWCDAFGQRFRDDSGGYQPGQFSPTGAQLIRHGKDFHDPDCSQDRESKMVEAAPGVHCDPCIAPIVAALNASGIATVASCCGHTRRPGVISLADGRELFIASDYLEARKIDAMFPVGINGEAAMTDQTLEQRARGLLASEFPLADGFSAVLVRDMSIPQLGVVDTAIALRAIVAALQAQQPGAQAVAWHTDDHLTDKSATTYDPVIADRWRAKGWPVTPHYTDPQPPSIPEPSEDDVEAALFAMDARFTKRTKRPGYASLSEADKSIVKEGIRAALTTYTARLRERLGQAPGGDGDAS